MTSDMTTNTTSSRPVPVKEQVPEHLLFDEKVVQASLGDFIADIATWLYRKIKKKYSAQGNPQKPIILCIDNEAMIQVGLAEYITRNGCTHVRAMNSQEAYAALDLTLPNLIFLDIHMPGDDTLALRIIFLNHFTPNNFKSSSNLARKRFYPKTILSLFPNLSQKKGLHLYSQRIQPPEILQTH